MESAEDSSRVANQKISVGSGRRRSSLAVVARFASFALRATDSCGNFAGRLLHSFSLMGAGAVLSGFMLVLLVALEQTEWTALNDAGVPELDQSAVGWTLFTPFIVFYALGTWANVAQRRIGTPRRPFRDGPIFARWTVAVGLLLCPAFAGIWAAILNAFDKAHYYLLNFLVGLTFVVLFVVIDITGRERIRVSSERNTIRAQSKRQLAKEIDDDKTQTISSDSESTRRNTRELVLLSVSTVVTIVVLAVYAIVVLPKACVFACKFLLQTRAL